MLPYLLHHGHAPRLFTIQPSCRIYAPMRVYCSDGEIFTSPEGLQFDYSMIFALEIKMVPNCSAIPVQDS